MKPLNQISKIYFLVCFFITLVSFETLVGQDCGGQYTPDESANDLKYKTQDHGGCEGFVVDQVSANAPGFDLVGLTYGKFCYDGDDAEVLKLRPPANYPKLLKIEATGVPYSLDYRMNAVLDNGVFSWNTGKILLRNHGTRDCKYVAVLGFIEGNKYMVGEKNKKERTAYVPIRIEGNQYNDWLYIVARANDDFDESYYQTNLDSEYKPLNYGESVIKGEPIQIQIPVNKGLKSITLTGDSDALLKPAKTTFILIVE